MQYVAIYQLGEQLSSLEFSADDWADAFHVWLQTRPKNSKLRLIAESEGLDHQILDTEIEGEIWISLR